MTCLTTSEEFEVELDALRKVSSADAGLIDALIEELMDDAELVATFASGKSEWHYDYNPAFEVKRFSECWNTGRRVYILKPYDEQGHLLDYRIFVGHDISNDEYLVLTVQPRSTCYDATGPAFRSLCDSYDGYRFPAFDPK